MSVTRMAAADPGAAISVSEPMPRKPTPAQHSKSYAAGERAFQMGQPCPDGDEGTKDGWFAAKAANLHIEEEWAGLFPHSPGFKVRGSLLGFGDE